MNLPKDSLEIGDPIIVKEPGLPAREGTVSAFSSIRHEVWVKLNDGSGFIMTGMGNLEQNFLKKLL